MFGEQHKVLRLRLPISVSCYRPVTVYNLGNIFALHPCRLCRCNMILKLRRRDLRTPIVIPVDCVTATMTMTLVLILVMVMIMWPISALMWMVAAMTVTMPTDAPPAGW